MGKSRLPVILFAFVLWQPLSGAPPRTTVPVVQHCARLYSQPNQSAKVYRALPFGELFQISDRTKKIAGTLHDTRGTWYQVQYDCRDGDCLDERCEKIRCRSPEMGWVFDQALGFPGKFLKVKKWTPARFEDCLGDYCPIFLIQADGGYTYSYDACVDGNCGPDIKKHSCDRKQETRKEERYRVQCSGRGHLYRYKNVLMLRHFNQVTNEFLYVGNGGSLVFPQVMETKCGLP